jgi:hypothetical protein
LVVLVLVLLMRVLRHWAVHERHHKQQSYWPRSCGYTINHQVHTLSIVVGVSAAAAAANTARLYEHVASVAHASGAYYVRDCGVADSK